MTTVIERLTRTRRSWRGDDAETGRHVVLEDVSWSFYQRLLREVGEQRLPITCDQGRLEITAPTSREHEDWKSLLGRLVESLSVPLQTEIRAYGSMSLEKEDASRGLVPDECFFIKKHRKVRGKRRWKPDRDPPPDLAIEIDITSGSIPREPIYAKLGVPEVWRFDGRRLEFRKLAKSGTYEPIEASLSFPFLRSTELTRFLRMLARGTSYKVIPAFQAWVRKQFG